jgi:hypothetical protein
MSEGVMAGSHCHSPGRWSYYTLGITLTKLQCHSFCLCLCGWDRHNTCLAGLHVFVEFSLEISLICVLYLKSHLFLKPCLCTELPCIDLDSYVCVNDASSILVASGVLWFLEKSGK